MEQQRLEAIRRQLEELSDQLETTAASLEEEARTGTGGPDGGNLSNAPMHLGDLGSEVYLQQLNATLLENEVYLHDEIRDALARIDAGTFGRCEVCGTEIRAERLDVLPYARHCTPCSAKEHAGLDVNFNAGRAEGRTGQGLASATFKDEDTHASGTPGGGSAVGGLAGTNLGRGEPDDADLEGAMGSSRFDSAIEEDDEREGYSGPSGGAVGGTPAGKRVTGGRSGA